MNIFTARVIDFTAGLIVVGLRICDGDGARKSWTEFRDNHRRKIALLREIRTEADNIRKASSMVKVHLAFGRMIDAQNRLEEELKRQREAYINS